MGDTDNDRVALHFELRYGGRSIDPSRYLPAR
jgi:murein DD-endopeptidase MepM/ murein hydrolase activator NlpD